MHPFVLLICFLTYVQSFVLLKRNGVHIANDLTVNNDLVVTGTCTCNNVDIADTLTDLNANSGPLLFNLLTTNNATTEISAQLQLLCNKVYCGGNGQCTFSAASVSCACQPDFLGPSCVTQTPTPTPSATRTRTSTTTLTTLPTTTLTPTRTDLPTVTSTPTPSRTQRAAWLRDGTTNSEYKFFPGTGINRATAQAACQTAGPSAALADITSPTLANFLITQMLDGDEAWISLYNNEPAANIDIYPGTPDPLQWRNSDGSNVDSGLWLTGQPNCRSGSTPQLQRCGVMQRLAGPTVGLADKLCTNSHFEWYICSRNITVPL
eukprot:TRINITY_DN69174_c0_g1_i1.p1 TRINITY_DN69174_c0_g1~~TRINITY_DN69174_c0_g1_i1.p1  ORF type:complete len:334 (-),score=-4.41 TRINITY_DN69174_c0_g1_i1:295-1257(-)